MQDSTIKKLESYELYAAAILLAASNFVVILDMTIANVSVPNIAGGLAVSYNEGTYVITSYAVAEAISVPLTGWLASRFGTVRVFASCVFLFGIFSWLCGLSTTLGSLVISRILQGLSGGPLMPLSQTLLLAIFPKNKQMVAMTIWSMTTLCAPILGPIVGGKICDYMGWSWIFLINIPVCFIGSLAIWKMLKIFETPTIKAKIDYIGLLLMVMAVASFQIMLDEGKKYDWFESNFIIALAVTALISFIAFLIWETTEDNPIVKLSIFKQRGYSIAVSTLSVIFSAFFGGIVILPLWLQLNLNYTASDTGLVLAGNGIFAILMAPIAANITKIIDMRMIVTFGAFWMSIWSFYRSFGNVEMTYWDIALPVIFQGMAMPLFFIPLSMMALSSVNKEDVATAAGLMNFIRTISAAISTSLVTTIWERFANVARSGIVSNLDNSENIPLQYLEMMVDSQSIMLSTNKIFLIISLIFLSSIFIIWLAPKPEKLE